jgi:cytochrome P450
MKLLRKTSDLSQERYVPKGGAQICGVFVPAGTNISMSVPVIHYDQSVFGFDADIFRPERWTDATPEQVQNMERAMLPVSSASVINVET